MGDHNLPAAIYWYTKMALYIASCELYELPGGIQVPGFYVLSSGSSIMFSALYLLHVFAIICYTCEQFPSTTTTTMP